MRIFISSTCYDLIDVRAELENELRQCGLDPVLSDIQTSDFINPGNLNSIQTCLSNVRSADLFVLILNQRYGAILKDFGNVSATHLEYKEAVSREKPILVYIRDRLDADYTTWKTNKKNKKLSFEDLKLPWAKDVELLEFLDEYRNLVPEGRNWVWPFRNSVDLKNRVCADLSAYSGEASVRNLAKNRMLPHLDLKISSFDNSIRRTANVKGIITNFGTAPALDVKVAVPYSKHTKYSKDLGAIAQSQGMQFSLQFRLHDLEEEEGWPEEEHFGVELSYRTLEGHALEDRYSVTQVEYPTEEGECEYSPTRHYIGKFYFNKSGEQKELIKGREMSIWP